MSLLQGLLRSNVAEKNNMNVVSADEDSSDSDYEYINVVSIPGTPARSRPTSRPTSPDPELSLTPLKLNGLRPSGRSSKTQKTKTTDPLRMLPTEIGQRIFGMLRVKDLARCARVCKRWSRSQTINYVWFQHYRKDNFHDDSLPPGKWTKRESKQNWRIVHLSTASARSSDYSTPPSNVSNLNSGHQTPREVREERWRQESEVAARPGKLEMRSMYKEMGGRKAKTKSKVGREGGGTRDKGGWEGGGEFDAPW